MAQEPVLGGCETERPGSAPRLAGGVVEDQVAVARHPLVPPGVPGAQLFA
jgi:hypothetical protein